MTLPVVQTSDWRKTTDSGTVSSLAMTGAANVSAGDGLLMLMCSSFQNTSDAIFDAVTGWTKEDEQGTGSSDAHYAIYWRIADGTATDAPTVTTSLSNELLGWIIRITGTHSSDIIDTVGTATTDNPGTSHPIGAITPTQADTLAFYVLAFDGGDAGSFSTPAGWTEGDEGYAGTGGGETSGVWGYKDMATAESTGVATVVTGVGDGSARVQFSIAPAAATTSIPVFSHHYTKNIG